MKAFFSHGPDVNIGSAPRAADKDVTCVNRLLRLNLPDVLREIVERSHSQGFTDNSCAGQGRNAICCCQASVDFAPRTASPFRGGQTGTIPSIARYGQANPRAARMENVAPESMAMYEADRTSFRVASKPAAEIILDAAFLPKDGLFYWAENGYWKPEAPAHNCAWIAGASSIVARRQRPDGPQPRYRH